MGTKIKGIDVSYANGTISLDGWKKIKNSGVDFAIIRAGYGRELNQKDSQFENNYKNAKAAGLKVGAYHYSYAKTVENAKKEAKTLLSWIDGKEFDWPIYFDIEDQSQQSLGKTTLTNMVVAFCEEVKKNGLIPGVYANTYWLSTLLDYDKISKYTIWCAQYNTSCTLGKPHDMWQYTSSGKISGFNHNFDMNWSYVDFSLEQDYSKNDTLYESPKVGIVTNTSSLNIRKGPSTETEILGLLYKNDKVSIIGENGDFYKTDGAYLSKIRIKILGEEETIYSDPKYATVVNTTTLNIRKDSNTESEIVGTLKKGSSVCLIGEKGDFYKIKDGYISKKWLDIDETFKKKTTGVDTLSKKKYGEYDLSDNFKLKEFACADGTDTVKFSWRVVGWLQGIRNFSGRPVHITSAYRTTSYNSKIGGAYNSKHTQGKAVDHYIGNEYFPVTLMAKYYETKGLKCIICYTSQMFVHIDSRGFDGDTSSKYYSYNDSRTISTFLTVLKNGSTGTDVKDLQIILNMRGYKLDKDGVFGSATLKAVKDFQKNKKLDVDGIVGINTWKALMKK